MEKPKPRHFVRDAIFLDIPYIVDSVCRHGDYWLNSRHRYTPGEHATIVPRAYTALPPFLCLVLVLLFSAYGATLGALCNVFGPDNIATLQIAVGTLCVGIAWCLWATAIYYFATRIKRRFEKADIHDKCRAAVTCLVLLFVVTCWCLPLALFGRSLLPIPMRLFGLVIQEPTQFDTCRIDTATGPAWLQLAALVVACVLAALLTRRLASVRWRITWQVLLAIGLVALLWWLPASLNGTEAGQGPYRHLYAVITVWFALTAWLACLLVKVPFASMQRQERKPFRDALPQTELFPDSRRDPPLSPRRIFGGGVIGVLQKPLQFLLLPCFAIILVPTGFIWHACILGSLASLLLIIASNLTSRWDQMSDYLRRYFLIGTPLVTSAAVIVIAALRLADVQYVATVLNVAPFGVLFVWMIMAYALCWWFEYQVNSVLAAELLKIFDGDGRDDCLVVAYRTNLDPCDHWSRVNHSHRYLSAHGIGQFVVTGWFKENNGDKIVTAFHTLGFTELFAKLLLQKNADAVHELGRRIQLYFALVNIALLIGCGLLFWYHGRGDELNTVAPVVSAQQGTGSKNIDLSALLQTPANNSSPAIVVAASGGGTRAALYTANVMRGLHELHQDQNVVLLSGVSGGGVAAAYFFGHRAALLSGQQQPCDALDKQPQDPWRCYLDRMTMPFIRDVLQGAGEWRVQSEQPLGVLLAESFTRRLFADGNPLLGDETALGLILNTTITGHPLSDEPTLQDGFAVPPNAPVERCLNQQTVSGLAGGRLAFTNLRQVAAFQKTSDEARDIRMPFVLVQNDRVALARAAALNANFPPVFPNARVDLTDAATNTPCSMRTYYVTDGGATENLGLVSALLALKSSLDEINTRMSGDASYRPRLRNIEIVLAEASATGYDYQQDRGMGAATGQSKERLTGRLTLELLDQVTDAVRAIDPHAGVRIHDLSLPRVFRSRGGFGTHWMFPSFVRVSDPLAMPLPSDWRRTVAQYTGTHRYWVTLDRDELFELWRDLYDPKVEFCEQQWAAKNDPAEDLRTVSNWICGRVANDARIHPDGQLAAWRQLKAALAAP